MRKHSHYKKITAEKRKERNSPKGKCESCQRLFVWADLITGPDPFASEINDDNTIVTQCKNCHHESCWGI
jgi:hypothetical protein